MYDELEAKVASYIIFEILRVLKKCAQFWSHKNLSLKDFISSQLYRHLLFMSYLQFYRFCPDEFMMMGYFGSRTFFTAKLKFLYFNFHLLSIQPCPVFR